MRKLSTKTKVPLDAVPERLTEQGSSIFRPGDQSINQLYLLFNKRKIQNGRFPQIALASRGGKRQERIGLHYSLSNLYKV